VSFGRATLGRGDIGGRDPAEEATVLSSLCVPPQFSTIAVTTTVLRVRVQFSPDIEVDPDRFTIALDGEPIFEENAWTDGFDGYYYYQSSDDSYVFVIRKATNWLPQRRYVLTIETTDPIS